jgi:hypothetical protein
LFCYKGRKKCFILYDLWWKIWGFEIFELTYFRNLRILIANWAQEFADLRFADLKKHLHAHLCKFATVVNHTGGKFATGVVDTGSILPPVSSTAVVNLPPVSTAPVVHLEQWIFPQIFEIFKIFKIFMGLGKLIHEKTWNWNSRGTVPLNFLSNVQNWTAKLKAQIRAVIPIQLEAIFRGCESTEGPSPTLTHTERKARLRQWRK